MERRAGGGKEKRKHQPALPDCLSLSDSAASDRGFLRCDHPARPIRILRLPPISLRADLTRPDLPSSCSSLPPISAFLLSLPGPGFPSFLSTAPHQSDHRQRPSGAYNLGFSWLPSQVR
jgi:hypothetical protein